jgi:hypothetical protein
MQWTRRWRQRWRRLLFGQLASAVHQGELRPFQVGPHEIVPGTCPETDLPVARNFVFHTAQRLPVY